MYLMLQVNGEYKPSGTLAVVSIESWCPLDYRQLRHECKWNKNYEPNKTDCV